MIRKRQSRKARFQKRIKANLSTDVCKACQGSGLLRLSANTTLAPLNDDNDVAAAVPPPPPPSSLQPTSPLRRQLHVAVIGGGISGLALAAACQHRNIAVTVYERDAHLAQRHQGYGLTLQQAALQLAALGVTQLMAGITSTKHIVHDASGRVKGAWGMRHWLDDKSNKNTNAHNDERSCNAAVSSSPQKTKNEDNMMKPRRKRQNIHIARQALRYELYMAATAAAETCNSQSALHTGDDDDDDGNFKGDKAPSSVIMWNHKLVHYDEEDDHVRLTFAVLDDATATTRTVQRRADVLVGADGIRSQVRKQLFLGNDEKMPLRYLGCIVILGICPLASVTVPASGSSSSFAHLLDGETVFQTADGVTRIYMMPYSTNEYMWQLSFPINEKEASDLSMQGAAALQHEAVRRCGTWHFPVSDILSATPVHLVSGYPVYDREIVHAEDLKRSDSNRPRRVTCLGDAMHCMSPFKGQGANQALLDALSLARALYRVMSKYSFDPNNGTSCPGLVSNADIEQAILQYEAEMLERTSIKVKASAEAAHFLHTDIAIQEGNVTRGAAAAASHEATCKETTR